MRWVFIALVLANVGMFFWRSIESSRQERLEALNTPSSDNQGVVSGAPLVLVSELNEQEKRELMRAKEVSPARQAPTVEVTSLAEAPVAQPTAPRDEKPPVQTPSGDAASKVAVVAPAPIPAITEPAATASKVLEPNQCLKIGPLVNPAQAEQVSQRLMAVAIISEIVDVDVPGAPEYWVILPPFNDEKMALQKLQELQGRAIPAQIIPKGEMANAISFGLHGDQAEANSQAAELNAKGYRVQVKSVPVIRKEKWLNLSERQAPKLSDELWQGIHGDFPKLQQQLRRCH